VTDFLKYAVQGVPIGCVFGLLAVGLVLNYKTSGVFNLAFAAQAYVSAAVFYVTRHTHEWPLLWAALLSIVVVGPLIGLLLDRTLYRFLRTATPLAKLVTSLGLLVAIPQIVNLIFGFNDQPQYRPPPLWPVEKVNDLLLPHQGATIVVNAAEVSTIVCTILVVVGLGVLFRSTALGLQMRAVVESPRLVELQGVNAERVSMMSWMLSSFVAGLAGVLMAPLFAQMVANDFFTLLVAALAATVFAGLTSIPRAMAGGVLLGVLQAELAGWLPPDNVITRNLRPSLPFLVLFLLLVGRLVVSAVRGRDTPFARDVSDPLAGVDPPPPPLAETLRPLWLTRATWAFGTVSAVVLFSLCWWVFGQEWRGIIIAGVCLGIVMMSMVMMTGIGGTISLCQATFAAIGAFTTAQAVVRWNMSVLLAMVLGAVVAGVVGAVLALPVIRLPGVYAALATLAFALMFETIIRPITAISGGPVPVKVPRPLIGSIDFTDDRYFLVLAAAIAALVGVATILVRRGTTGRFLDAVRGSEVAASSIGISPGRQRLIAFALSAAMAGLGGGLIASYAGQASYESSFVFFYGLVWLTLVVSSGVRSVQAAVTGGIGFFVVPKLLEMLFSWPQHYLGSHPGTSGIARSLLDFPNPNWGQAVAFILFGLGALTYAKHPEGIIEFQTSRSINKTLERVERRKAKRAGRGAPPGAAAPVLDRSDVRAVPAGALTPDPEAARG
jgi:branched-subunit amino acid ABC-type transport system permease component